MTKYTVQFVHKVSSSCKDTGNPVDLASEDLASRAKLAAKLRESRNLIAGGRIGHFRVERDGRVVAFPQASIWHAIILTPEVAS